MKPSIKRKLLISNVQKTISMFAGMLPILLGVILLTGLILEVLPVDKVSGWFGKNVLLDSVVGATFGSVSAGHPLTSYVLGGELLTQGISLVAVTALLVSWVTVGSIQFPAEAIMLGRRFALYRNLICFIFSILIAVLTVATMKLFA